MSDKFSYYLEHPEELITGGEYRRSKCQRYDSEESLNGFSILLYFLTFFYIALFILMKYAAFPRVINLPTGIIFFGSILFPPILLVLIPMYYSKSIQKLNPILT